MVSIFQYTHNVNMHAYTEGLCGIYVKIHCDLLKNRNLSKKKISPGSCWRISRKSNVE